MKTYRDHLNKKFQDEEFARIFQSQHRRLRIACEIREARLKNGLTQKELAAKAGRYPADALSRRERGYPPMLH